MKVWIDGEVLDGADARIPVTDHGLLYGDGVFEGLRVYGRRVFRLEDHLRRLRVSAAAIGLELPGGTERLREIVLETARAFSRDDALAVEDNRAVIFGAHARPGETSQKCHLVEFIDVGRSRYWR